MKNTLVDVRQIHARTGQPPLFLTASGRPVWPHRGAEGDDDGENGDDGDDDGDNDSDDDGSDDDADDSDDDKGGKDKKNPKPRVIDPDDYDAQVAHKDRLKKQLSAADKRKSELEKENAALKAKDLPDKEKVAAEIKTLTEERDSFKTRFTNLARTNAFLTASARAGVSWEDVEDAMSVAAKDLRDLDIDEDGTVDGIDTLVKDLAKRKPHLVKKAKSDDGKDGKDDDKGKSGGRKNGASGSGVGSRGKRGTGDKGQLTDEQLMARFPALRRSS